MLKHKYIRVIAFVGILVLFAGIWFGWLSWYALLFWVILWLGITTWGSFDIRLNYFTEAIHQRKNHSKKEIALTFDDGPHPNTEKILNLLKEYGMKATFFCIGTHIEKYSEIARRIVLEGHEIGNHTYSHSNKTGFLSEKEINEEIVECTEIIERVTGKKVDLFRPPFGVTNPNISKAVKKNKLKVIGWNIRSLDTVLKTPEAVLQRIVPRINNGSVVLFHDNRNLTTEILERLLITLKDKHFTSVTLSDLFNIKPYNK